MFIVLSGYAPFSSETNDIDELFDQILSGKVEFNEEYWNEISLEAKDLILKMLNIDIDRRYTAEQVLNHNWMKVSLFLSGQLKRSENFYKDAKIFFFFFRTISVHSHLLMKIIQDKFHL